MTGVDASDATQILSIDFVGGRAATAAAPLASLPSMSPAEVAGVKPASHWNSAALAAGSLSGLALADGSLTAAAVTWNSPVGADQRGVWWLGYADAPGDVRMMNGFLDPHSATAPETPAVIVVSGLPPAITARGYDVYVYTSGNIGAALWVRTYHYSISGMTVTTSQAGMRPTPFSGYVLAPPDGVGNYVIFHNLTSPSFTLTATPGAALNGAGERAPVNGIQIVSPSGS